MSVHPYNNNSIIYNTLFHPLHNNVNKKISIITNITLTIITGFLWQIPFWIVNRLDNRKVVQWKSENLDKSSEKTDKTGRNSIENKGLGSGVVDKSDKSTSEESAEKNLNQVLPEIEEGSSDDGVEGLNQDSVQGESKALDPFSEEEMRDCISSVKKNKGKEGDTSKLDALQQTFMDQCTQAEQKALHLHENFKEKFKSADEDLPEMVQEDRTISTLTQFKFAQSLLKKEFPGLSSLPSNGEQKCAVARLMQIIMCGKQVESLPKSFHCFLIREVEGKSTEPSIVEKDNFLTEILAEVTQNRNSAAHSDHLKENFLNSVSYFVNDCVLRSLNTFKISDQSELQLGGDTEDPAAVANSIKEQLIKEFKADAEKVKTMVAEAKAEGSFAALLKEWFPDENANDELLSEERFKKVFEGSTEKYSEDNTVVQALNRFAEHCRLDDETAQELASNSECKSEEVKSLVRLRFLQMVVMMNQAQQKDGIGALQEHLLSYGEGGPILNSRTVRSVFSVAPDKALQNLSTTLYNSVFVSELEFKQEGIVECFEDRLNLATVTTQDTIESFTSGTTKREIQAMTGLLISWQIPEAILDHLVSQIDAEAVKNQPSQRYPQLKEQLFSDQKVLEALAKINSQSTEENLLGWNNWFQSSPVDEEFKDVQKISQAIVGIEQNTHNFMRTIALIDQKGEEDIQLLGETRDRLVEVSEAIKGFKESLDPQEKEEQIRVLDYALSTVDQLIQQLPKNEEVQATYWTRIGGALGQSQEAKDLEWKVMKYETQICELKKHMEVKFSSILKPDFTDSLLTESWLDIGNDDRVVSQLHKILCEVTIDPKDYSRFNQKYLGKMRHLINKGLIPVFREEFKENPDNTYLHQFAEILFTSVSLEKQCFETLDTFNRRGAIVLGQKLEEVDETAHGEHPFVKRINTVYHRLGAVPYSAKAPVLSQWANSARGQWNRNFDPYRQGNPTHQFWNLRVGDKEVKMLGMGTPTNEDSSSVARLNEEFVALMRQYKTDKKKHLFVNNQNLLPKTGWVATIINGDETARCNKILDKQDDDDVKGAYFAIALSKNSTFYWQKGEFAEKNNANTFKDRLFKEVCQGERHITGSYIPETIRESIPDFNKKAINVITLIHQKVFDGKEELSVEERRWFIELFYDNLVKMIIVEGKFDSMNGSCKDQIDRGAGTNAQLAANCYIVEQEDGQLTEEQQLHVMMLMMVRALLVRKRPPLPERVERFAEGMDMSFKHVEQLKALHKSLFSDISFKPERVDAAE